MKRILALTALAAASLAHAQQADESRIATAFTKLSDEKQLYVQIEGSETTNGVTNVFKTHLYWQEPTVTKPTVKFQLLQEQDGVIIQRVVGNGETVWNYDHRSREYSAMGYGGYGAARPANYRRDLLTFANQSARGQAAWGARLIRELFSEGGAVYRTWMPGVRPTQLPDGASYDPVWSNRTYVGAADVDHIMYNSAPRRTIVFELRDDPPSDDYRLSAIYFNERGKFGTRDRLIEWKLTPFKGIAFDENNFLPYSQSAIQGWRPVTGPQGVKTSG